MEKCLSQLRRVMVWEGIELLPVVDEGNKLQGIISRQDVLQALQMIQRQPQVGETIDDIVTNQFMTPKEAKMSIYINFQ